MSSGHEISLTWALPSFLYPPLPLEVHYAAAGPGWSGRGFPIITFREKEKEKKPGASKYSTLGVQPIVSDETGHLPSADMATGDGI